MQGTVVRINDRGFGFIRPENSLTDIFFHCEALSPQLPFDEQLTERRVVFDTVQDQRNAGKQKAVNVRPV